MATAARPDGDARSAPVRQDRRPRRGDRRAAAARSRGSGIASRSCCRDTAASTAGPCRTGDPLGRWPCAAGRVRETAARRTDVDVVLVDAPELFDRDGLYGTADGDYADNAWRFAVFSRAALEYARRSGERPSVIHAHDWQAGLVAAYQKMHLRPTRSSAACPTVFTIHNLAFQGVFPPATLDEIGLGWEVFNLQAMEYWGQISYLKAGINFSEKITTVSPNYAREIVTPEMGFGFDGVLSRRARRSRRHPQRHRHRSLESGRRSVRRGAVQRRRPHRKAEGQGAPARSRRPAAERRGAGAPGDRPRDRG